MIFKRINLTIVLSATLLSGIAVSCGEEEVTVKQEPVIEEPEKPIGNSGNTDEDRYVYAGVNERINDIWVPRIYGPGDVPSEMTDGKKNASITAMAMDEQRNLYAVGWHENSLRNEFALYWKNCVPVLLTDSTQNEFGSATGIFIAGNDVYISGETAKNGHTVAVYWKNGEKIELTAGVTNARAANIYVSGDDVYVTGNEKNSKGVYEARLWKNGVAINLLGTYAHAVSVSGDKVYVTGDFGKGKYWMDGVYKSLGSVSGSGTGALSVAGETVYMTTDGRYWKDNTSFTISTSTGSAPSIYSLSVFKDDVYVSGFLYKNGINTPLYWKNDKEVAVTDGTHHGAVAAIVVVSAE